MDVLLQVLDVHLQLTVRAPRDVLQTVDHVQVYVLPVDLLRASPVTREGILPVVALDHGAVGAASDKGRLRGGLRLLRELALEAHVLLAQRLHLGERLLQLLLEPAVVLLQLRYLRL